MKPLLVLLSLFSLNVDVFAYQPSLRAVQKKEAAQALALKRATIGQKYRQEGVASAPAAAVVR